MGIVNLHRRAPGQPVVVVYPAEDGKPMAETGIHVLVMMTLIATLRLWFRRRGDVYVIGNIFLYYEEGNPKARRTPDVMVIKGVDAGHERNSFMTWQEKAAPSVIFEITSRKTKAEDQGPKPELYRRLGVKEYFLFDPLHDYLPQQLMGYRLVNGAYQSLTPGPDGALESAELNMRLVPEGTQLALFDLASGERVPTPTDSFEGWQQAKRELEQSQERIAKAERAARRAERKRLEAEQHAARKAERKRLEAEQRATRAEDLAEQAKQLAEQARQRAAELESELARLRATGPAAGRKARKRGPKSP
jgi:Uma2 family endonuclease